MIYSRFILLYFMHKIGCVRVAKTAFLAIDARAELETENFLADFITDLKISSFETTDFHWLTVMGTDENFLRATKVLLESGWPYFVITKTELRVSLSRFSPDSIALFFVDGLRDFQIISAVSALPTKFECRVLMISMKENTTDLTISETLKSAAKMKITNVSFAKFDGRGMKIYRSVLGINCEEEISLFDTWVPRKGFANNEAILGHVPQLNGHGCPMIVSTFESLPKMMLRKNANGTLEIRGGAEGHLVNAIAKYLKMVPVLKLPSINEHFWIFPNGTAAGIVADVADELAIFGIGQIRPTVERSNLVDISMIYSHECLIWAVPLKLELNQSIITSEFSPITWIIVALSVILCCGLTLAASKFHGASPTSASDVFDVIAVTLNYAIPRQPTRLVNKLLFLMYLHYSRILSTAYSASLASMLMATTAEPTIQDEDGIISAGLRTSGPGSYRDILTAQIPPNSTRAELVNRFEAIGSFDEALSRIADRKDTAYLRHHSTINYAVRKLAFAGKPIEFYPIFDCVISYNSVVISQKGSHLTKAVGKFILRLRAAGIDKFWSGLDPCASERRLRPSTFTSRLLFPLKSVFFLYLICLVPAFFTFGAELLAFKLKFNWFITR